MRIKQAGVRSRLTIMITPTPWIERKFEFNFPVGLFPVIIERLSGTLLRLEPLRKIRDEILSEKKDGKWSIKEIVGHLSDLEDLWSRRIDDFLARKEILQAADMTNAKTHASNHNSKAIATLLDEFMRARNDLIKKVETFDEGMAGITSIHPRLQKPMRLVDLLFFIAEHDDHELTKIELLLAS
jgi:uncharacterized damage-inducible protein DinB